MTRITRIGLWLAILAVAGSGVVGGAGHHAVPPAIVLAELFTSEGCSSCPPADTLLRRLVAEQPIEGVEIVALGNHVDYWDQLGWRDPFSSALLSRRQSSYSASVFHLDSIYTPQLIVDGTLQSAGNDEAAVRRNIAAAARQPKALVEVSTTPPGDGTLRVDVQVQASSQVKRSGAADIMLAVTEDGLVTRVARGENGGRTLAHSAVVRRLDTLAQMRAADLTATATLAVKIEKGWTPEHLRLVAFVQERASRRILGAGATMLPARGEPQR